jgi:hypothetical protein
LIDHDDVTTVVECDEAWCSEPERRRHTVADRDDCDRCEKGDQRDGGERRDCPPPIRGDRRETPGKAGDHGQVTIRGASCGVDSRRSDSLVQSASTAPLSGSFRMVDQTIRSSGRGRRSFSSRFDLECPLERLASRIQAPFHSARGDRIELGDVGDRAIVDVMQHQDRALVRIKSPECTPDQVVCES